MNVRAFNDMQKKIASTYIYAADGSMKNAVNEFIPVQGQGNENIEDNIADIQYYCFDRMMEADKNVVTHLLSLNGAVTVVANDPGSKCVDFCVLTKTCTSWEKRKNSEAELGI